MNAPLDPQREQGTSPSPNQPATGVAESPEVAAGSKAMACEELGNMASWLFWIAGLTLLNVALPLLGMGVQFLLGLAVIYWLPTRLEGPLLLAAQLAAGGIFAGLALFTRRGALWAFFLGSGLYLADAVLAFFQRDNLNLIVHLVLLAFLVNGFLRYQKAVRAQHAG